MTSAAHQAPELTPANEHESTTIRANADRNYSSQRNEHRADASLNRLGIPIRGGPIPRVSADPRRRRSHLLVYAPLACRPTAGGRFAPGARTLAPVKTKPKVTIVQVTDDELRAEVRAWQDARPGYDRTNYVEFFRDESGELIETDEFFRAAQMYAFAQGIEIDE